MRKVFSSHSEVAKVWASQRQDEGSAGRVYFIDETIYSYGSHFPMATIRDGVCFFTLKTYSNSTAKHLNHTRHAADGAGYKIVYCWDLFNTEASLNYWESNIRRLLDELSNKRNRNTEGRIHSIRCHVIQLEEYCQQTGTELEFELATLVAFCKGDNVVSRVRTPQVN